MSMKKISIFLLSAMWLSIFTNPTANAESKLTVRIEIKHLYLNGFKPQQIATLGDEWTIFARVRDDEGDPAAGSEVRIYRGKKQIAFGRTNSKGRASIQLPITRLGLNSLKVTIKDSNPAASAEANLDFEVVRPNIQTSVLSQPSEFFKEPQKNSEDTFFATNIPVLIQSGCKRYWTIEPSAWPFAEGEEIQKWGSTSLPRVDQSKIETMLTESFKGWAFTGAVNDGSAPLIICDIAGVLTLFNG
jgi:hypothetical protein